MGDVTGWASVVVAAVLGVLALVFSGLSRRDSKNALTEAERSTVEAARAADAAEQSARADQETHRLEQLRDHRSREPQLQATLGWAGDHGDIPEVVLDYQRGPELDRITVTLEPATGHRPAITTFGHLGATWTHGNLRPGGWYRAPASPPEPFGGRSWLLCHCVAGDEEWVVPIWVDAPRVGTDVGWQLTRSGTVYRLHNTGGERATGVHVDFGDFDRGLVRDLPDPAVVEAHNYQQFWIVSVDAFPDPTQVWVRWDGCEQPVPVSVTS